MADEEEKINIEGEDDDADLLDVLKTKKTKKKKKAKKTKTELAAANQSEQVRKYPTSQISPYFVCV